MWNRTTFEPDALRPTHPPKPPKNKTKTGGCGGWGVSVSTFQHPCELRSQKNGYASIKHFKKTNNGCYYSSKFGRFQFAHCLRKSHNERFRDAGMSTRTLILSPRFPWTVMCVNDNICSDAFIAWKLCALQKGIWTAKSKSISVPWIIITLIIRNKLSTMNESLETVYWRVSSN